jgi:hypothetical protein
MNCNYCEDHLSDYLENALVADERSTMESHLISCSACSELLAGVRDVIQWGREFPAATAPEWLSTRIIANTPIVIGSGRRGELSASRDSQWL